MHLATKLSLWSLYRHSIVQLAMVLLSMEGADQARKVKDLLLQNCDQVSRVPSYANDSSADP
jgi:hypothetical protein